jgi:hypothetical protein
MVAQEEGKQMTKGIHLINTALYTANALMWGLWAHSIPMAMLSFAVALGSAFYAEKADHWTWK